MKMGNNYLAKDRVSVEAQRTLAGTGRCAPTRKLFGFEVTVGHATVVADVPVAVDLGRVRTGRHIEVGDIDAVDRDAGRIPGVDVCAQVARLPAEGA